MTVARVHERGVHLVGEDPSAVPVDDFADGGQFAGVEHPAQRIVRVAEHQQVSALAVGPVQGVEVVDVPAARPHQAHLDDPAAEQAGDGEERGEGGNGNDDGEPGREKCSTATWKARTTSGSSRSVGGRDVPAVGAALPVGARLAQAAGEPRGR